MVKTKGRKVLVNKCRVCQGNFETTRRDSKTCGVNCRQKLYQQELAKRLRSYSITTREEFKEGMVEVLPRMATRYDSAGELWVDFNWTTIPQRQKDLMEVYARAEGISVDTLQRHFEQTLLERLRMFQTVAKRERHAQEAQEHRTAEIAEVKAELARMRAMIIAAEEEAARTGQPVKFQRV